MNILQISFHTAPMNSLGVNDGGGLNVYVESMLRLGTENSDRSFDPVCLKHRICEFIANKLRISVACKHTVCSTHCSWLKKKFTVEGFAASYNVALV